MRRRFASAVGLLAWVALAFAAGTALAFDEVRKTRALEAREFFKPELYLSTSNVPGEAVVAGLPNRGSWARFADAFDRPVVYLDPRSGAPSNVVLHVPMVPGTGDGNHVSLAGIEKRLGRAVHRVDGGLVGDLVRRFVVDNREAFAIDPTQLGPARAAQPSDELWHVTLPQVVDGIPVRHARIGATLSHGNLILLGTETWGNASLDTKPCITALQAMSLGFDFVGGRTQGDVLWRKPELEIVPVAPQELEKSDGFAGPIGAGYRHRLVWSFGFRRQGEDPTWEILVDAHDGEVLAFEDRNRYEAKRITGAAYPLTSTEICPSNDRCGVMVPNLPMPFTDTGLPAPNDYTNGAGLYGFSGVPATTTLYGRYVGIGDACGVASETAASGDLALGGTNGEHDCAVPAGSSAGNTAASRSAFYEINKLIEVARGWLPGNPWLAAQIQAGVNLNQSCNAFYSPVGGSIHFYRSGGGCRNTGEIAAVFDHEWGHALDDNDSGGELSNSSEAYADIAAIYRLQASCVGYGFWWTNNRSCGTTSDGSGFNANESLTGTHCALDCSGVRDCDWDKHEDHVPDTPANFTCVHCLSGSGPCGRQVHCAAAPTRQAAWDFVARDLAGPPFNLSRGDAFIVGNKIFYQGSGNIGFWHACACPGASNGCAATNGYMQWLAADDDDGNLANGTPHMTALFAAFDRHRIACATPAPVNSGCAGAPVAAPALDVSVGSNALGLSWTAVPGASFYRVLRSEGYAGCDFGKAVMANVSGTSYTDLEVANGTAYSYVVQAVGTTSACFGPGSACVTATPQLCAGSISLARDRYNCSSAVPLTITLVDADLTGSGARSVAVRSSTEPGPETAVLTEAPAHSGVFTGTFATTTGPAVGGDGAISISGGDTIVIEYVDASYCGTPNVVVSKTATVDCAPPSITNVRIESLSGSEAEVTFTTDEPTDAVVRYGTVTPPGSTTADPAFTTSHRVRLEGLSDCTAYRASVQATDPHGNSAMDDNAGAYYRFLTLATPTPTFAYTGPPVVIPDSSTAAATIAVSDVRPVQNVRVKIGNLVHTYDADLDVFLVGPEGTRVELTTDNGGADDNFLETVLDDSAAISVADGVAPFTGTFRPEGALSTLQGIPAVGTWTLELTDDSGADTGVLTSWELELTFPPERCPTAGLLSLDRTSYACSGTAGIRLVDFSIQGAHTQYVTVRSTTEAADEIVVLSEFPAASAEFHGSVPLTTAPPEGGDGILAIANGDTITVTYVDADDGIGGSNVPRIATAVVDCAGPTIANVQATDVSARSADLTWTTNEPADSSAVYGAAPPPATPLSDATPGTSHVLHVTGLAPCTPYVFDVSSTDGTGNRSTADNGGSHFAFTTTMDTTPVFSFTGPIAIPDNDATGAAAVVQVGDVKPVHGVSVSVAILHANVGDLEVYLVAPNGTTVPLAIRRGGIGDHYTGTVFDDAAAGPIAAGAAPFTGSFRPESPLGALDGAFSNGAWTLRVRDRAAGTTGTISSWELHLTYPSVACGAAFVQEADHSVSDTCSSGASNGIVDPGDEIEIPVRLANTGNGPATGITATLTTSTSSVAIVDGLATYGSMGVGQLAFGDAPFVVDVGGSVPCGTSIDFEVHVASDQGSFTDAFHVRVGSPVVTSTTRDSIEVPKTISDHSTVTSTIAIAGPGTVDGVRVTIGSITHTYDGDLDVFLIGPNGTRVELTTDNGGTGENFVQTTFDDAAATWITSGAAPFTGAFQPEGSLATLDGIPAAGTWTLEITDDAGGDTGTLAAWSLTTPVPGGYACDPCSSPPPPGEAAGLVFTSPTSVAWTPAPGATRYYLYCGFAPDLPKLRDAEADSCERSSTATLGTAGLGEVPAAHDLLWCLVRGWNRGGLGPAGSGAGGPRIQDGAGPCP